MTKYLGGPAARRTIRRLGVMGAALVAIAGTAPASAAIFTYSIPGFNGGASLSGFFTGDDLDGNGLLEYDPANGLAEVTDFSISFTGNAIGPFTLGFADLNTLTYDFDGSFGGGLDGLNVDNAAANNGAPLYVAGFGDPACTADGTGTCFQVGAPLGGQFENSASRGTVTAAAPGAPAPELGMGLLASLATGIALFLARRRKPAASNAVALAYA